MKVKKLILCVLMLGVFTATAFADDIELARKSTINTILNRGELRVGFDAGYMPFEMVDKNGQYIGFDIDIAKELAKAMGVKFVPVNSDFDGLIPSMMTDKFDVIISGMTITPERNLKIGFSDPYIVVGQTMLVHNKHEGKITSYEQLNSPEYTIIARQGTTSEFVARRVFTKANIKTFEKEADGALEVINDRGDAWIYDMPFNVVFFAEQGQGKVFHLDEPFTYEPLGIGIRQGDPDFMNFINNFLKQIRNDGRYDRIYNKWIKSSDWFAQTQK